MIKNIVKSLLLAITLMVGSKAQAQDIEIVNIELNKEYSGDAFKDAYFCFTAPKDGKLVFAATRGDNPTLYTDATFTTVSDVEMGFSFVDGGKENDMLVTQGTTYYFAYKFPISEWTFTARMDDALTVTMEYAKPAPDQEFPLSDGGFLEIHFNTAIYASTAIVQTGTTTAEVTPMVYGRDISMELKNILFSWMQSGVMKAGDTFTVTINAIKSAQNDVLYNGDGMLVLTYTASAKPTEIVKVTVPEKFMSYWPVTVEDGIVILEYDGELSTEQTPVATLSYGEMEVEGDYYVEDLPVSVEGKKLVLDFRGRLRLPAQMVASGTVYEYMNLKINNIRTADGNYVYSDGKGTFGSYQQAFVYEQVAYDLATEFLPASGASLQGVNSVELWLSNPDAVSFDGVGVTYKMADGTLKNVDYTLEQCNYKNDGIDGITMNVPITEEMQTAGNVTITLQNLVSNDGIEREIQAVYNVQQVLEPISITPANHSQVVSLEEVVLQFSEAVSQTLKEDIRVTDATGRTEVCKAYLNMTTNDDPFCEWLIKLEKPITEAGIYKVIIPAASFRNAQGHINEEIVLNYEVKAKVGTFIFTPASGTTVASLKQIIVEYSDVLMPSWNGTATLSNVEGEIVATAEIDNYIPADKQEDWENYRYDPTGVILTFIPEITAHGTYILRLPAGYMLCGATNDNSPELTATFTVGNLDAIASITDQSAVTPTVYTLDGRRMPLTSKAQLRQLKPGVYLINGKKVVLSN